MTPNWFNADSSVFELLSQDEKKGKDNFIRLQNTYSTPTKVFSWWKDEDQHSNETDKKNPLTIHGIFFSSCRNLWCVAPESTVVIDEWSKRTSRWFSFITHKLKRPLYSMWCSCMNMNGRITSLFTMQRSSKIVFTWNEPTNGTKTSVKRK